MAKMLVFLACQFFLAGLLVEGLRPDMVFHRLPKRRVTLGRLAHSFGKDLLQSVHVSFVLPKTKRASGFTVGNLSVGQSGAWTGTLTRKGHDPNLAVVLDKLEHVSCCRAHGAWDLKTRGQRSPGIM